MAKAMVLIDTSAMFTPVEGSKRYWRAMGKRVTDIPFTLSQGSSPRRDSERDRSTSRSRLLIRRGSHRRRPCFRSGNDTDKTIPPRLRWVWYDQPYHLHSVRGSAANGPPWPSHPAAGWEDRIQHSATRGNPSRISRGWTCSSYTRPRGSGPLPCSQFRLRRYTWLPDPVRNYRGRRSPQSNNGWFLCWLVSVCVEEKAGFGLWQ
uniref:Uncharacterized protein n=1 Tax=Proboscia inermis TaxID=420281 RepID=A0A7S0C8G1_9STRA